jgi:hypothetical protein
MISGMRTSSFRFWYDDDYAKQFEVPLEVIIYLHESRGLLGLVNMLVKEHFLLVSSKCN